MRRRSERSRLAILEATRAQLMERGFDGLTIEGVAAAAGVGKQTIYRWWRNRTALVADVLADEAAAISPEIPFSGGLIEDLTAWTGRVADILATEQGRAIVRTLSAAGLEDAATEERFKASLSEPMREKIRARFAAADSPVGAAAAESAMDAIVGGMLFAVLLDGADFRRERAELLAQIVVTGAVSLAD